MFPKKAKEIMTDFDIPFGRKKAKLVPCRKRLNRVKNANRHIRIYLRKLARFLPYESPKQVADVNGKEGANERNRC